MTQPILGSNLMLFVHKKTDGGSTTKAVALACATACKLDAPLNALSSITEHPSSMNTVVN